MRPLIKLVSATAIVLTYFLPTVQAGTSLVVEQQASPALGFNSFLIKAVADAGDLVASIIDLRLTGAHQVQEHAVGEDISASLDQIGGTFWNDNWTAFDSHLLLDLDDPGLTTSPGFSLSETNDECNPGEIDLSGPRVFELFEGRAGIGNLQFEGNAPQITILSPRPQEIDLLQVVVPTGTTPHLSVVFESNNLERNVFNGLYYPLDGNHPHDNHSADQSHCIPEPSTLLLTTLGLIGFATKHRSS